MRFQITTLNPTDSENQTSGIKGGWEPQMSTHWEKAI